MHPLPIKPSVLIPPGPYVFLLGITIPWRKLQSVWKHSGKWFVFHKTSVSHAIPIRCKSVRILAEHFYVIGIPEEFPITPKKGVRYCELPCPSFLFGIYHTCSGLSTTTKVIFRHTLIDHFLSYRVFYTSNNRSAYVGIGQYALSTIFSSSSTGRRNARMAGATCS